MTAARMRALPVRRTLFALMLGAGGIACGGGVTDNNVQVGSIELLPDRVSVRTGFTVSLAAIVRDPAGKPVERTTIFWSSSDTAIAVVSSTGIVTARRAGSVQVAASAKGMSATAEVTVADRDVASVSLLPAAVSIRVGATTALEARPLDAEGNLLGGRTITYTTSNAAVATVSSTGVVTGVAPGNATITATSEGRSAAAAVTVTLVPVATVDVTPTPNNLSVGETVQLTAVPRDATGAALTGRVVTWSSSDTRFATVSSNGLLRAVGPGSATITATVEGRTGTASVVVAARPVDRVTVTPASPGVTVGGTVTLAAQTLDDDGNVLVGRAVSWTSGSTAIATVNAAGVVTGVSPGTVVVTATSEGRSGSTTVTVSAIPVATVTVTPGSGSIFTGRVFPLTAVARSASGAVLTGRPVTWQSGAPGVATVSATGVVTGVSPGTAVIIAAVEGQTGSSTITVRVPPVATIALAPANPGIGVAGSVQLVATLRDEDGNVLSGRALRWESSNEAVAFVSSSGLVIGFIPGTATITVTSEGISASTTVTVGNR